jgi:hypothetical protein
MRLRPKLTYANVMVTVLAFLVLAGGGAYAASQLGKGTVGAKQLKKNAVTSPKVKDGALKAKDFAAGQLPQGAKGAPGAPGAPGIPGTSHAYEATGSVNYDKFSDSLFGSTVVSLAVPPGAYFVTSAVQVQTVNAVPTTVTCRLIDGNGGGETTWATTRSQATPIDTEPYNFTLTTILDVTPGQKVNLQCSKGAAGSSARVNEANIVAVQISDVTHNSE